MDGLRRDWGVAVALLLVLLLTLNGCQTSGTSTNASALPTAISPGVTSAPQETVVIATMVALPTLSGASATESAATGTAYPVEMSTAAAQGITPPPGSAPAGVPFQDCARTPGLPGCGALAEAIHGRVSFWDMRAERLVTLDLFTGQGWQASFAGLAQSSPILALEWSPKADKLLAAAGQVARIYDATGQPIEVMSLHAEGEIPAWNADDALDRPATRHAANGTSADLQTNPQEQLLLHVTPMDGPERTLPLDVAPTGEQYGLLAWVPGQDMLLAQRYYASNAAMLNGGELLLLDAKTGALQPLGANVRVGHAAALAWDPSQAGRLAFLETGANGVMAPRLGVVDFPAGTVGYPLPENRTVSGMAWQPGTSAGQAHLVLALVGASGVGSSLATLDLASGALTNLTKPPSGALDGWPHWSADGKVVIYARSISAADSAILVELRAHRLSDDADWLLVAGLNAPQMDGPANPWDVLLAFGAPANP